MLLIGINNGLDTEPWAKLDWLLGWFAAAYPRTKVLVVAPLPSFRGTSGTLAARYRPVVHRWPGVGWSTCGAGLNWRNASLFTDGLHLTPEGYRIYFSCLKPTVATLLKGAKGGGAAAQAQGSKKGG